MSGLQGKVVICTGSGRREGLGEGILQRFAAEGCKLVVTDLGQAERGLGADDIGSTEEMEAVAQALRESGAEVLTVPCDVRKQEQVEALFERTVEAFGRVDVLVNNAGVGYIMQPITEIDLVDWQLVMDVNLTGAFLTTQAAAAYMRKQGDGGRIINIASQAAKTGFPHMAPYVASKHGLIGLTRTAAIDLAADGITVNAVCPNHVTTGLGAKQSEYFANYRGMSVEDYRAGLRARIPLGRVGLPGDTAAVAAFLASEDASFITGEAINVSGGEEMH
ncbi:MAG: NAD(P)-dependent dehydrogenase (short-subunit alcohol dehydrogenase family) [Halieaceae bacterium]|jgi:NAD(P)-dependent dehydrogenase (short-subunit alcohol dehydrogenase family)